MFFITVILPKWCKISSVPEFYQGSDFLNFFL